MDMEMIRQMGTAVLPAEWPELGNVWLEITSRERHDWELVAVACTAVSAGSRQAVGGGWLEAVPAMTAIGLMQQAIILADDLLDDDPRGIHRERGPGYAANMALAFQGASTAVWQRANLPLAVKLRGMNILARCVLDTAVGQWLDTTVTPGSEPDYWRVVRAKSTPFYGAALALGAVVASASASASAGSATDVSTSPAAEPVEVALRGWGILLGEAIQVKDDLADAFAVPAAPDWYGGHNLLILYATLVGDAAFARAYPQVRRGDPDALEAAQQALVDCGAVNYVQQWLVRRREEMLPALDAMPLVYPDGLRAVLTAVTDDPLGTAYPE